MSEITTKSTRSFTTAKIDFMFCMNLGFSKVPINNALSTIIINGDRTIFINDAVKLYGKTSKDFGPIACTDGNNFLDCQTIGKIVGRTFAYQVDCDE